MTLGLEVSGNRKHELDGLRALAVTGVMYSHFWNQESSLGQLGVRMFFVLSGFLITNILLNSRKMTGTSFLNKLFVFYVRRSLRIWPIYFLLLAALIAVNAADIRYSAIWHLFFASNFWFGLHNSWDPWVVDHFWTLSIEEQFYLFWPFVILFVPHSLLRPTCWFFIVFAVLFRILVASIFPNNNIIVLMPPASFDALATGALLSLGAYELSIWKDRAIYFAALAVVASFVGLTLLPTPIPDVYRHIWIETAMLLPIFIVIARSAIGLGGLAGAILKSWPVRSLGVISYGVYLYHLPVEWIILKIFEKYYQIELTAGPSLFFVCSAISIATAMGSWLILERPLNALKSRIEYGAAKSVVATN